MDLVRQNRPFEQLAALLAANGVQPQRNDTNDEYVARIEAWNLRRNHLNGDQINVIRNNAEVIRANIDRMIVTRTSLMAAGQAIKWVYTLSACIQKAGSWGQLVKRTAELSPGQLASVSFGRTIASNSMWIITAGLTAFEIGREFKRWYNGKITGKQFWVNVGKRIIVNSASVVGGSGGAAAGAAIGMCLGPVGGIVGAIIGGLFGSTLTAYATEKILESFHKNYSEYTPTKLIVEALDFFVLPQAFSRQMLQSARRNKIALYHPDMWRAESQERQRTMAERYSKTQTYYQILSNALEARNPNVEPQQLL